MLGSRFGETKLGLAVRGCSARRLHGRQDSNGGTQMRTKKLALAVFVMLGLALVALPVHAQSNIVLGTSTQGITFTGTGSSDSVGLDLGACGATTCTMSGV